ncbi:phosphoglycolate phosphatase [Halovenus salina]|uniref:Phosphoglycolate phosphatase n=1 Tax=Halovenus salina TaxID=1510225 RepID=A0ABD5VXV1_9EURY
MPESLPPLTVDIDGTLTDDSRAVDPRVFPVLQSWPSAVVIATGKAMPYPVSLCEFLGIETRVIAENGGVVIPDRQRDVIFLADPETVESLARAYQERGHSLGWGSSDLVNRWRATELAVSRDSPLDPLVELADEYGLTVVDTGYAYHVHEASVDKGVALQRMASELDRNPGEFAFIGDSPNDVPGFEIAGTAVAVDNAPDSVKPNADYTTSKAYGGGFLEAVEWLSERHR